MLVHGHYNISARIMNHESILLLKNGNLYFSPSRFVVDRNQMLQKTHLRNHNRRREKAFYYSLRVP